MKFTINYFWRIIKAEISLNAITLIGGKNYNGKSSICKAVGFLLSGKTTMDKLPQTKSDVLINDTSTASLLKLESENGIRTIEYPGCKIKATNNPPCSSTVAVAWETPIDMKPDEKAKYFSELLKTNVELQDLTKALNNTGLSEPDIQSLWDKIQKTSFDTAHEQAVDKGRELKANWKFITGEAWGENKGENWKPSGFLPSKRKLVDIENCLTELKSRRDTAIKRIAVDGAEKDRLKSFAEKYETVLQTSREYEAEIDKLNKEILTLKEPVLLSEGLKCPECGTALQINNREIVKAEPVSEKDIEKSKRDHTDWEMNVSALKGKIEQARNNLMEATQFLMECRTAKEKLEAIENQPDSVDLPADIEQQIIDTEAEIKALKSISEAKKTHEKIVQNLTIVEALSPNGVRKTALEKGLDKLNNLFDKISTFGTASITPELDFYWGKYPYQMCSGSLQFRLRVLLQACIAILDESTTIVIDAADILDIQGKNELFQMLEALYESYGLCSLVTMTFGDKSKMPDLGGLVKTYWVEDGKI